MDSEGDVCHKECLTGLLSSWAGWVGCANVNNWRKRLFDLSWRITPCWYLRLWRSQGHGYIEWSPGKRCECWACCRESFIFYCDVSLPHQIKLRLKIIQMNTIHPHTTSKQDPTENGLSRQIDECLHPKEESD